MKSMPLRTLRNLCCLAVVAIIPVALVTSHLTAAQLVQAMTITEGGGGIVITPPTAPTTNSCIPKPACLSYARPCRLMPPREGWCSTTGTATPSARLVE